MQPHDKKGPMPNLMNFHVFLITWSKIKFEIFFDSNLNIYSQVRYMSERLGFVTCKGVNIKKALDFLMLSD